MIKRSTVLLVVAILVGLSAWSHADQTVTTKEGRKVLLKDDGTWEYVATPKAGDSRAESVALPVSQKGTNVEVTLFAMSRRSSWRPPVSSAIPGFEKAYQAPQGQDLIVVRYKMTWTDKSKAKPFELQLLDADGNKGELLTWGADSNLWTERAFLVRKGARLIRLTAESVAFDLERITIVQE